MKNRSHTIEEESFFPSITDLMVGIIFIFIIIVMSLVLQIKDRQKIIPTQLLEKMVNLLLKLRHCILSLFCMKLINHFN